MPRLTNTAPKLLHPFTAGDKKAVQCRCDGDMANDQFVYCVVADATVAPSASACAPPIDKTKDGVKLSKDDRITIFVPNQVTDFAKTLGIWAWLEKSPNQAKIVLDFQTANR